MRLSLSSPDVVDAATQHLEVDSCESLGLESLLSQDASVSEHKVVDRHFLKTNGFATGGAPRPSDSKRFGGAKVLVVT